MSSTLKKLVNDKQLWESFCEELDVWVAEQHKNLEQAEHPTEVHRAQGSIATLRRLKYLRDKINGSK